MSILYARFIAWAARNLAWLAICATLLAGLVAQTLRIEGVNLWPIKVEGYKAANARLEADLQRVREGEAEALERATRAREAQEASLKQLAEQRHAEREEMRPRADRALRDYAASRVQSQTPGGASSGTIAPATSGSPGVPADLPTDAIVATSYADLQICTELASYALGAHLFAVGLDERNAGIAADAGELPPITAP